MCGAVRYEASDAGIAVNCHCSRCRKWHGAAFARVRPSRHVFVGSKAPWFEITDSLPQHESSSVTAEGPPRVEPAQGT